MPPQPRASFLGAWTVAAVAPVAPVAPVDLGARAVDPSPPPAADRRRLVQLPRPGGRGSKRVRVGAAPSRGTPWPASTDQWCWHCCHPFEGQPLPLPIKYDDRMDAFHVMGTFCSWACMKTHNWESPSYMKSVVVNNITLFHKRCTGALRPIRSAPPRQALKVFGGMMTIDEFRAAADSPTHYTVVPDNVIVHRPSLQCSHPGDPQGPHDRSRTQRRPPDLAASVTFDGVATKNETLRLKRSKPLRHNRNMLEQSMGLSMTM